MTGEKIGDKYFQNLHDLRNDAAQHKRNFHRNTSCESMSNDMTKSLEDKDVPCEAINNSST